MPFLERRLAPAPIRYLPFWTLHEASGGKRQASACWSRTRSAAASLAVGKVGLRSLALTLHKELEPAGIHLGTATVAEQIQPGTPFDPERIAEAFWDLHSDANDRFRPELVFQG